MTRNALKAGKREFLRMGDLKPHPRAQREMDMRRVAEIAEHFDPAALGTITVVRLPNGKCWIVDGQTRSEAARVFLNGDDSQMLECIVIPVENDQEAGELFLKLNNHKPVSTFDKFLVRLLAKDATAVAIEAIIKSHGLRISKSRGAGVVQAVAVLESTFNRPHGSALLDRTISIVRAAWGDNPDAYSGVIIGGLSILLSKHGAAVESAEMAKKLAKLGPNSLVGYARQTAQVERMSVKLAAEKVIRNEYNKGRRVNRLEERAA
jgi:hypothetical protein